MSNGDWTPEEIAKYHFDKAMADTRKLTVEEREETWLQAVGSALWDRGIEAGEWIGFQWESAQDTAQEIAKTPGDVVKQIAEGVTDAAEIAVTKTADIVDNAVEKVGETLEGIAGDIGDTAKIMAIGGILLGAFALYRYK